MLPWLVLPALLSSLLPQAAPAAIAPPPARPVEVTFYTHGSRASDLLPLSRNSIFTGGVWLDAEPLFGFLDGPLPRNDRYVVFRLPAGKHVLGTGEGRHPEKDSLYEPVWLPGEHIYLRIHEDDNALSALHRRFEPVACATALADLQKGKVLSERAVTRNARRLLVPDAPLPVCP